MNKKLDEPRVREIVNEQMAGYLGVILAIIIFVGMIVGLIVFSNYAEANYKEGCLDKIAKDYCTQNNYTEFLAGTEKLWCWNERETIQEHSFNYLKSEIKSCTTKDAWSWGKND